MEEDMTQRDIQLNDLYRRKLVLKEVLTWAIWCDECRRSLWDMMKRIDAQIERLQGGQG